MHQVVFEQPLQSRHRASSPPLASSSVLAVLSRERDRVNEQRQKPSVTLLFHGIFLCEEARADR